MEKDEISPEEAAESLNKLLGRMRDAGWLKSSAISSNGQINIEFTPVGGEKMKFLHEVFFLDFGGLSLNELRMLIALTRRHRC